jgi:PAS domain S-box-containing protein
MSNASMRALASINRSSFRTPEAIRTLVGVAIFVVLSVTATSIISVFATLAADRNDTAEAYEGAVTELNVALRGVYEAALTEGNPASIERARSGIESFRKLRREDAELHADTALEWPNLDRRMNELMEGQHNVAFADAAMIELGSISVAVEKLATRLDATAKAKRLSASYAENHVQVVNLVAGALMILGTALFFIMRDLAARRVLEVARANESQLRDITDAVPSMICYIDAGTRFRFHNKATHQALGLTPGQIDGLTMREVFGDAMYEDVRPRVEQVLSGTEVTFEYAMMSPLGELRDYAVHYFPRHLDDRADRPVIGFYTMVSDITESKRIDRMKTEFVSTVSHELRTPLTSIRGSLGLLAGGIAGALPPAAKNLLDIAKNNCERLIRLINDMLDTEKIESGQLRLDLKPVDLRRLVEQTLEANASYATEHGVKLELHAGDGAMRVNVDADRVVQAITNLLSNAVKFSPREGVVTVTLSHLAGVIRLEVSDRGPGIPEEFRSRIFQKFSQADSSDTRPKGGSGLGLNITKAIIERLGGAIGFYSQVGVGSRFFFDLPEWRDAPDDVAVSPPMATGRERILVCEDDPDIGRLIGMMLNNAGYDTDLALTAARARQLAGAGDYAAMTVDLKLPDQDGIALIRALRTKARTHDLPIVVLSAYAENGEVRFNSESLSISEWLGKPIDENRLVLAMRHATEEGRQKRPRVLHIERNPDARWVSTAMAESFATFDFVTTVEEARARLDLWRYDAVIIDSRVGPDRAAAPALIADIFAMDPSPPIVLLSESAPALADRIRVAMALVKADTSNEQLLSAVRAVIEGAPLPAAA